jgi:hypothetical protein
VRARGQASGLCAGTDRIAPFRCTCALVCTSLAASLFCAPAVLYTRFASLLFAAGCCLLKSCGPTPPFALRARSGGVDRVCDRHRQPAGAAAHAAGLRRALQRPPQRDQDVPAARGAATVIQRSVARGTQTHTVRSFCRFTSGLLTGGTEEASAASAAPDSGKPCVDLTEVRQTISIRGCVCLPSDC